MKILYCPSCYFWDFWYMYEKQGRKVEHSDVRNRKGKKDGWYAEEYKRPLFNWSNNNGFQNYERNFSCIILIGALSHMCHCFLILISLLSITTCNFIIAIVTDSEFDKAFLPSFGPIPHSNTRVLIENLTVSIEISWLSFHPLCLQSANWFTHCFRWYFSYWNTMTTVSAFLWWVLVPSNTSAAVIIANFFADFQGRSAYIFCSFIEKHWRACSFAQRALPL